MSRKFLSHTIVACALTFGLGGAAFGQEHELKKAGEAAADAGKDAGKAAEHAGKAVAKSSKKAAKATKKAVTPDTTTAACKDGTVQQGKTKTTACAGHGGVQ
jgi:uncharacterized protein HemX